MCWKKASLEKKVPFTIKAKQILIKPKQHLPYIWAQSPRFYICEFLKISSINENFQGKQSFLWGNQEGRQIFWIFDTMRTTTPKVWKFNVWRIKIPTRPQSPVPNTQSPIPPTSIWHDFHARLEIERPECRQSQRRTLTDLIPTRWTPSILIFWSAESVSRWDLHCTTQPMMMRCSWLIHLLVFFFGPSSMSHCWIYRNFKNCVLRLGSLGIQADGDPRDARSDHCPPATRLIMGFRLSNVTQQPPASNDSCKTFCFLIFISLFLMSVESDGLSKKRSLSKCVTIQWELQKRGIMSAITISKHYQLLENNYVGYKETTKVYVSYNSKFYELF